MRIALKVRKKGILILPKALRESCGITEGDEVIAEAKEDMIVIKPLKPKIVEVNPKLVEELLSEEFRLEAEKYEKILKDGKISSRH
jgi:AbrB family looped-hinge helix DNA binding protein